mmetsp:Transcript_37452/g.97201  ORF Transcript_37452/g.97201 Transcript_37452/m.97201 type:complete len:226 (-) Transcript_37452:24-701(-)
MARRTSRPPAPAAAAVRRSACGTPHCSRRRAAAHRRSWRSCSCGTGSRPWRTRSAPLVAPSGAPPAPPLCPPPPAGPARRAASLPGGQCTTHQQPRWPAGCGSLPRSRVLPRAARATPGSARGPRRRRAARAWRRRWRAPTPAHAPWVPLLAALRGRRRQRASPAPRRPRLRGARRCGPPLPGQRTAPPGRRRSLPSRPLSPPPPLSPAGPRACHGEQHPCAWRR